MEQTQKETKTTKSSSSSSSSPPWLDLPDPVTELILERLPLLYYLLFAAVCRKWRSIQKSHRLRCSPSPPPMAPSLPLLIAIDLLEDSASIPNCYSPFDQTLHRLRLPSPLPPHDFVTSSHGWLLLLHKSTGSQRTPSLLNPITGAHILLPPLTANRLSFRGGAISAPPSDPHCSILIVGQTSFLYRRVPDSNKWNRLDFPPLSPLTYSICNAVFHRAGKFYCVFDKGLIMHVLDPSLPAPSMQVLKMEDSRLYPYSLSGYFLFQELNGEILVLVVEEHSHDEFEGFHLFRADLSRKIWVSVEGIGYRALFVDDTSGFSLFSADVGCDNNCIYLTPGIPKFDIDAHFREPWRMFEIFNLETRSFISEQQAPDSTTKQVLSQFDRRRLRWFVPSL